MNVSDYDEPGDIWKMRNQELAFVHLLVTTLYICSLLIPVRIVSDSANEFTLQNLSYPGRLDGSLS